MRQVLERAFTLDLSVRDDGRTVEGIVVPWGETAHVIDHEGEYEERFVKGAFQRQAEYVNGLAERNPGRSTGIPLSFTHDSTFRNIIGFASRLEERDMGLWAEFRLLAVDADKAREMLTETCAGLSAGFLPIKSRRTPSNVVERVQAHLDHVAAVPDPAYAGAGVLAIREDAIPEHSWEEPKPQLNEALAWLDAIRRG